MKRTKLFTKTSKTVPAGEVARNAQLLIQAGFIHKEMAGAYAFLPLGLRVIEKIKNIVREEMNAIGGQELMMTTLQPRELFERTNRWDDAVVDNWFKTKLANGTELGLGLTHEEPIVMTVGEYAQSYKDLPLYVYQIAPKFRNELRAKSGILRGREFLMKDMYSFARSKAEHDELYEKAAAAYTRMFDRLGIGDRTFRTKADGGYFTDDYSDEYQTLSDVGEDIIYLDEEKKIAINKEVYTDETVAKLGLDKSKLVEKRSIEAGNIFPLETKYTDGLDVYYTDENGERQSIIMGCYGIGISRTMGILAEVFADDKGLVWPSNVAPFQVYLINIGEDETVVKKTAELYEELNKQRIEVLWDDRPEARPGEKFADADLMGIPWRVVVSGKTLDKNGFELKARISDEILDVEPSELMLKILDQKFNEENVEELI